MPISIRRDQTVSATETWSKGTPPGPFSFASSDPTNATVGGNTTTGNFSVHPVAGAAAGTVTVTVRAGDGSVATDTVEITDALPNVGTIQWGTPSPA